MAEQTNELVLKGDELTALRERLILALPVRPGPSRAERADDVLAAVATEVAAARADERERAAPANEEPEDRDNRVKAWTEGYLAGQHDVLHDAVRDNPYRPGKPPAPTCDEPGPHDDHEETWGRCPGKPDPTEEADRG